jgi:hypothetical protein
LTPGISPHENATSLQRVFRSTHAIEAVVPAGSSPCASLWERLPFQL